MEERNNKTIICSVLFLDIVEYAKKTVAGQISLKDRFNAYLSEAIGDVPVAERIILDTGDGAAINFLGDVEAALNAALRLRTNLLAEDPYLDPQLLVRIGINLGPVRLVRDINGQPNIVGDGINVAQRIMGFADPSQILVSRSYYDAVSRLSPQYPGMFHYQGSRTDKHVREHEIYAIGYPGDQATRLMDAQTAGSSLWRLYAEIQNRIKAFAQTLSRKFRGAGLARQITYVASGVAILLLGLLLFIGKLDHEVAAPIAAAPVPALPASVAQAVPPSAAAPLLASSSVAAASSVQAPVAKLPDQASSTAPAKHKEVKAPLKKPARKKPVVAKAEKKGMTVESHSKPVESHPVAKVDPIGKATIISPESLEESRIIVNCKESAKLFLDGIAKGAVGPSGVTLATKPGKHRIIISYPSYRVYSVVVVLDPGKSIRLQPKECN